ncbi:MAG: hypothetical protein ACYDH5_04090 [Acidimicrobiales bacterium]
MEDAREISSELSKVLAELQSKGGPDGPVRYSWPGQDEEPPGGTPLVVQGELAGMPPEVSELLVHPSGQEDGDGEAVPAPPAHGEEPGFAEGAIPDWSDDVLLERAFAGWEPGDLTWAHGAEVRFRSVLEDPVLVEPAAPENAGRMPGQPVAGHPVATAEAPTAPEVPPDQLSDFSEQLAQLAGPAGGHRADTQSGLVARSPGELVGSEQASTALRPGAVHGASSAEPLRPGAIRRWVPQDDDILPLGRSRSRLRWSR